MQSFQNHGEGIHNNLDFQCKFSWSVYDSGSHQTESGSVQT